MSKLSERGVDDHHPYQDKVGEMVSVCNEKRKATNGNLRFQEYYLLLIILIVPFSSPLIISLAM